MSKPEHSIVPATRPMRKSDYETIYRLLEAGTPEKAILAGYPITLHTLKLRMKKDRPELHAKLMSLRSPKQVNVNDKEIAAAIIQATGRILAVDLSTVVGHDVAALAADVREQQAAREKDPNVKLVPVGLPVARSLHALVRTAAMIPGIGLEAGGGGVTINTNNGTVNHAGVMRLGGGDIFADADDYAGAIVDVESEEVR